MNKMKTKVCPRCGRELTYEHFYYNYKSVRWLSYCKECHARLAREKYESMHGKDAKRYRHYSDEEIKIVVDKYRKMSAVKIAEMIGRSPSSVRHRAQMMGLHRFRK